MQVRTGRRNVSLRLDLTCGKHVIARAEIDAIDLYERNPTSGNRDVDLDEAWVRFGERPELKTGFPILYDAEVEDYVFDDANPEIGGALGYRWRSESTGSGFDVMAFYYERDLADEVDRRGTFYGGDLDILSGPFGIVIPSEGRRKEEYGAVFYSEVGAFTLLGQTVQQGIAGLGRQGLEIEAGWQVTLASSAVPFVQPAIRYSSLEHDFRGPSTFPAPTFWWDWRKYDAGVRFGLTRLADVTVEYSHHDVEAPRELDLDELLVTMRIKLGTDRRFQGM